MWNNLQLQVKDLFESTQETSQEVAQYISENHGMSVHPSEVRHAVNSKQTISKKGRKILLLTHRYLTQVQEEQNREIAQQMRRAEKALSSAQ